MAIQPVASAKAFNEKLAIKGKMDSCRDETSKLPWSIKEVQII